MEAFLIILITDRDRLKENMPMFLGIRPALSKIKSLFSTIKNKLKGFITIKSHRYDPEDYGVWY